MRIKQIKGKGVIVFIVMLLAAAAAVYLYQTKDIRYTKSIYEQNAELLESVANEYESGSRETDNVATELMLKDTDGGEKSAEVYGFYDGGKLCVICKVSSKATHDKQVEQLCLVYKGIDNGGSGWSKFDDINDNWSVWRYRGPIG
ncbi:MAG: hypothetical protein K6F91_07855 [Ruminococcus sp.]|nr:hypothetical protein [Ruminococcus sp.]